MSDLATLVVSLEAETSKYTQAITAATKQLQDFQNSVGDAVSDLATKFTALFTVDKISDFIEGAIESASALQKLSEESGVAVESLSAFSAVAAQAGVGQDEMSNSLKKLNQAISDAAGSATSKAAFAFQALGLSVTNSNGSLKTAGDLLPQIADAYSKLADGPNKVAINTDLLGRSAQALIPTLNAGADGLNALEQAATASGAALSADLAKAADDLEKKFIALKQSTTGVIQTDVLEAAIPILNSLADGLSAIGKAGTSTNAIMEAFSVVLKGIGEIILEAESEFKQLGSAIDGVRSTFAAAGSGIKATFADAFKFDFSGVIADVTDTGTSIVAILDAQAKQALAIRQTAQASILDLLKSGGAAQVATAEQIARAEAAAVAAGFAEVTKGAGVSPQLEQQLTDAEKKVSDFAAQLKVQADSFSQGAAAQTAYKLSTGALGDAVAKANATLAATANSTEPGIASIRALAQGTLDAADAARAWSEQLQTKIDDKTVTDFSDKLQEQVDKFQQTEIASVSYQLSVGKLGDALTRAKQTLADMAAGTIPVNDALKTLAQNTVDAANKAQNSAFADVFNKDQAPLQNINNQILTLEGNLVDAQKAAFAFQNALLIKNVDATNDTSGQAQLDTLNKLQTAQAAVNQLTQQYTQIQQAEAVQEAAINAAVASGQDTTITGQEQIAKLRQDELTQLQAVYDQLTLIPDAAKIPQVVAQFQTMNVALKNLKTQGLDPLAKELQTDFINDTNDAFAAFVSGTETAGQAAKQFLNQFETQVLELANKNLLQSLLGDPTTGAGGIFGALSKAITGFGGGANSIANPEFGAGGADITDATIFGGGLASGGPAKAGMSYTVGEHGAEEFVPNTSGTIIPNSKMNKGQTIIQNFTIQSQGAQISRPTQQQVAVAASGGISMAARRNT